MLPLFILEIGKKPGHGALEAQLGEDGKAQRDPQQQFPNPDELGVEVAWKEIKQVQCAQCHPDIGDQGGFEALAYDQSHGANLQQSNQVNR
jgi:mono/diheme cytochrome c family protein